MILTGKASIIFSYTYLVNKMTQTSCLKKMRVKTLLMVCPSQDVPSECAFGAYKDLDVVERVFAADTMTEKELEECITAHRKCRCQRIGKTV